ncbi:hypothetical protein [Streptomyces nigrescens]|nr:hypothetical protein [Streptomyces nigrescens]
MKESSNETRQKSEQKRKAAAQARRTAERATAPAGRGAKKAVAATDDAVSAAEAGTERAAEATSAAARTAARGVESGRQALITASGRVAATAKTAWVVLAHRKWVATGMGAGAIALSAASYGIGRRAERHSHGPLTRLTQGRI